MEITEETVNKIITSIGIIIMIVLCAGLVVMGIQNVNKVEGPRDCLTFEEINWLEHHHDMTGYSYNLSNFTEDCYTIEYEYQKGDREIYSPVYDIDRKSIVVNNSGIEDGMIYTLCDAKTSMGLNVQMLYINDPITLEFVALSVMYENMNGLFTFKDRNGLTVYER